MRGHRFRLFRLLIAPLLIAAIAFGRPMMVLDAHTGGAGHAAHDPCAPNMMPGMMMHGQQMPAPQHHHSAPGHDCCDNCCPSLCQIVGNLPGVRITFASIIITTPAAPIAAPQPVRITRGVAVRLPPPLGPPSLRIA